MSAAQSNEQYAKAFDLLQGAEAELRGAAEERRTYTKSYDSLQTQVSRTHVRVARIEAHVLAIVKHFGIKLPASTYGSHPPASNDDADSPAHRSPLESVGDDEELTLHGKKVPVVDGTVAISKSDFAMLKSGARLVRIGFGIGEKVLIAFGAAVLMALATLAGAWVHGAYIDAKHFAEPVPRIAPALDRIGPAPAK